MTANQLIAKLLNRGYAVCGWDEKTGEIDLSKNDKYIMVCQKENHYGYFAYAKDNKWIIPYMELA